MLSFFTDCVGLFASVFSAAMELEFFRFLAGLMIVLVSFGLFVQLQNGLKKL